MAERERVVFEERSDSIILGFEFKILKETRRRPYLLDSTK